MSRWRHILLYCLTFSLAAGAGFAIAVTPIGLDANKHYATATDGTLLVSLGTPEVQGYLQIDSVAAPGTPAPGVQYLSGFANNGQDQLTATTSDGVTTVLGSGNVIVRNTSGSPMVKGQAVYVTGSTGNVPNVALARSNAVSSCATYGVTLTSIANNAYGRIMRQGVISGIDTSAFSAGNVLWTSSSVAGAFQNTDPTWPNYSNHVGVVLVSGVGSGSIAVTASPTYGGQETGTTASNWTTGPGSGAGAVTMSFANANTGILSWTPTASRTLTLPDTTGSLIASTSNRLPPIPAVANALLYDSGGTAYAETAACGTAGTILQGGSPPACTATPTIGTNLTVPRINSSGLILDATTGNNVQISIDSTTVETVNATGVTLAQPLAMSSQKITGLATATTSGDALAYPWITATTASATGTTTTLNQSTGTYQDITGMSVSINAGTHEVEADVRASISESTGAGSFITCRFHDGTNPITDTETIVVQANSLNLLYQNTAPIGALITVGTTTSIKVQCARTFSGSIITSDVTSDTNGKCRIRSVKVAP